MRIGQSDEPHPEDQVSAALAALGLKATEPLALEEPFVLWPENFPVLKFWMAVSSQWREGINGRSGLDYAGVEACMRLHRVPVKDRAELFHGLQVMERATLSEWAQIRQSRGRRK